jgi:hypothetical protein
MPQNAVSTICAAGVKRQTVFAAEGINVASDYHGDSGVSGAPWHLFYDLPIDEFKYPRLIFRSKHECDKIVVCPNSLLR